MPCSLRQSRLRTERRANQALEQTRDNVLRYGESVGCELLNFAVRQPAMILRIFRVEIDPSTRSAFEAGFRSLSADAVTRAPGNLSCEIGMPTRWAPNTYSMITRWRDEEALVAFAGPEWNTPVIPAGMEAFGKKLSVEHYRIDDYPIGEQGNAADSR
jgi:heme oxygenase (mycobilin-producing)